MPPPTPIYVVLYGDDDEQLPGYVQSEARPIALGNSRILVPGRDGGLIKATGADLREITLTFLIKSRLTDGSGLDHLNDCLEQYQTALAILMRRSEGYGLRPLHVGATDRHYMAMPTDVSAPLEAGRSRAINYTVSFVAESWSYGDTALTASITGTGTTNVTGLADSRRTYPVFSIPSGVTAFTASDAHGHTVDFLRGTVGGEVIIDCAKMLVTQGTGSAMAAMQNLDFGMYYDPYEEAVLGTLPISVAAKGGSGTVEVSVTPRYEF